MKKIPMRTCVITGEKLEKKQLIRADRTPEGNDIVDETGKANDRGAYIKKDIDTFNKAEKSKVLDKRLEVLVPASIYEELRSKVGA